MSQTIAPCGTKAVGLINETQVLCAVWGSVASIAALGNVVFTFAQIFLNGLPPQW
jgi:hypothetical protein